MKSWNTTISGLAVIAGLILTHFYPEHEKLVASCMAAAVAYGLISAKDDRKSRK